MKKLLVVSVIVVFGLTVFTSCNIPDEVKKKYEIELNETKTTHKDVLSGGNGGDDEETGEE